MLLYVAIRLECMSTNRGNNSLPIWTRVLRVKLFMEGMELRINALIELKHRLLRKFGTEPVVAWWVDWWTACLSLSWRMTTRKCVCLSLLEFEHFGGQVLDKASEGLNISCSLLFALARCCLGIYARILGVFRWFFILDDSNGTQIFLNSNSLSFLKVLALQLAWRTAQWWLEVQTCNSRQWWSYEVWCLLKTC